jgi:hypothetical protein
MPLAIEMSLPYIVPAYNPSHDLSQTVVWRMKPVLEIHPGTYPDMPLAIRSHDRWITNI